MRYLGIDFGSHRIGLSLSDPLKKIALPVKTYSRAGRRRDLDFICAIIEQNQVELVVMGLPLNMDGTQGLPCVRAKKFGNGVCSRCKVKVVYQDERLTSVEANELLQKLGVSRERQKDLVDTMAAQLILQSYLDTKYKNGEK